jgi:hypothetical protein
MNVQRLKRRRVITSLLIFDTNQYLGGVDLLPRTTRYDDEEVVKLCRMWMTMIRMTARAASKRPYCDCDFDCGHLLDAVLQRVL